MYNMGYIMSIKVITHSIIFYFFLIIKYFHLKKNDVLFFANGVKHKLIAFIPP